jgi:DNA-directed RNA polymerase I subunit RPA1
LLEFYPPEEYTAEYEINPEQLHESLAFSFADRLKREIQKELRLAIKTAQQDLAVGQGLRVKGNDAAEDEEDDEGQGRVSVSARRGRDDELEDDDEDAGQLKRSRQSRQHEYEDDEEDGDRGVDDVVADLEDNVEGLIDDEDEDMEGSDPVGKATAEALADKLSETFKSAAKYATSFSFDLHGGKSAQFDLEFPANSPKLLLVDIVERSCRAAVVHEVDNIGRCMKIFDDKGEFTVSLDLALGTTRGAATP